MSFMRVPITIPSQNIGEILSLKFPLTFAAHRRKRASLLTGRWVQTDFFEGIEKRG